MHLAELTAEMLEQLRATLAATAVCVPLVAGPLVTVVASSSPPPRATATSAVAASVSQPPPSGSASSTPAQSAAAATGAVSQPDTNPLANVSGPARPVSQLDSLLEAVVRLPVAAALGAALAFRPRRRGTPPRTPAVIQTQIVLAVLGSLIMLIVGASLARAFGIVGAAGLIRYRAKIDDPKDAAVMLGTLGVGLATGVGLYLLSAFATLFILVLLLAVESLEEGHQLFELKVKSEDMTGLRGRVESLLSRSRIEHELRSASEHEVCYAVKVPLGRRTDRLSDAIMRLDPRKATAVEWDEKKAKS